MPTSMSRATATFRVREPLATFPSLAPGTRPSNLGRIRESTSGCAMADQGCAPPAPLDLCIEPPRHYTPYSPHLEIKKG